LGNQPAFVSDEHFDDLPFGRREADLAVGGRDPFCGEVDAEGGGLDDGFLGSVAALRRTAARTRASSSAMPNGLVT